MKILSKAVSLFAVLALVFSVVGCNGGGGKSDPPPEQNPNPEPIPVPQPQPVLVVFKADPIPSILPFSTLRLVWSAVNADSCEASGTQGTSWFGSRSAEGSETVLGLTAGQVYTFNLVCTGLGGSVSGAVDVSVPLPQPTPVAVSVKCTPGYTISRNPQGFQKVGLCNFTSGTFPASKLYSSKQDFPMHGLKVVVDGPLASYVTALRARGYSKDGVLEPLGVLVGGKQTFSFNSPVVGFDAVVGGTDGIPTSYVYRKITSIVWEATFSPIPPCGTPVSPCGVIFTIMETSDIMFSGSAVVDAPFPLKVASVQIGTGTAFSSKNSEIIRRDMETGEHISLTYLPDSNLRNPVLSKDKTKVLFVGRNGGLPEAGFVDVDGMGCTVDDIAGVLPLSPGCNKNYQVGGSGLCKSDLVLSPNGDYVVCMGSTSTEKGMLITELGNTGVVGVIQDDGFVYESLVISPDLSGMHFTACRPDCGVYYRGFDWSAGTFGSILPVVVHQDWHIEDWAGAPLGLTVSIGGKVVFGYSTSGLAFEGQEVQFLATVNADGVGVTQVGNGRNPQWISEDKFLFVRTFRQYLPGMNPPESVIVDADGGNAWIVGEGITPTAIIP